MPDPFKKLVSTLETRFNRLAAQAVSGLPAELGTMTSAGLKLDSFNHEIPDYGVADWTVKLQIPAFFMVGTTTAPVKEDGTALGGATTSPLTRFDFTDTEIEEVRIDWQSGLRPGDRVLAVPVQNGNFAVVVCKVVGADG
ncbi:hypothetical protein [Cohnella thermotolerans]|uniref:hypothetical protein n=1 Tax=Cohnella thermotolerans TaxID=329858 RepID=UPI0004228B88|nr:hypothetical protein [Cohnella thermotolerans]